MDNEEKVNKKEISPDYNDTADDEIKETFEKSAKLEEEVEKNKKKLANFRFPDEEYHNQFVKNLFAIFER